MIDTTKLRAIRARGRSIKAHLAIRHVTELRDLCNAFLAEAAPPPAERRARPSPNRMETGGLDRAAE